LADFPLTPVGGSGTVIGITESEEPDVVEVPATFEAMTVNE